MSIRMRHTKSHTGNRRAHHGAKVTALQVCPKCKEQKMAHRVCLNCGTYKDVSYINVMKKVEKIEKKAKKAKGQVPTHKKEHKEEAK